MRKKELFWLLGTAILVLFFIMLVYGSYGINLESTFFIHLLDTYFDIKDFHFIFLIGGHVFFAVYLLRTLRSKFRNLTANLVLIISTILLILGIKGLDSVLETGIRQNSGWTIYPPLSAGAMTHEIKSNENNLAILSNSLLVFQISLLIFLAYAGFRTVVHYLEGKKK